ASITTRESFRPRLRINERLDGLASTGTRRGSALPAIAGAGGAGISAGGAGADARVTDGAAEVGGAILDEAAESGMAATAAGAGEAVGGEPGRGVAPAIGLGTEAVAFPATSIIIRLGSLS